MLACLLSSVSPICLFLCQVLRMSAAIISSVSVCVSTLLSKVCRIILYAGFICQQLHVNFCVLEEISYLELSTYYCKQFAMSNSMSLHMSISISSTMLESVYQLLYQV
jgi:hypothetical protein